ncbi:MAG: cytochrome c [SAR324 cluster bacterium]|nr:cytochrome c [SAR324 cluster bacterium]
MWTPSAKLAAVQGALMLLGAAAVAGLVAMGGRSGAIAGDGYQGPYGFGTPASEAEIAAMDIDIMPDGHGLPPGSGTPAEGEAVYQRNCAPCHGANLEGSAILGADRLIGGRGSLATVEPIKTVESYWPYATTLYDYIGRAMPFNLPGSLSADEVYAVVAYILMRANIVEAGTEMNAQSLPQVRMPNRDGFIPDSRPDVFDYN